MEDSSPIRLYETNDRILVHNTIDNYLISIYRNKTEMTLESVNILNNININKVYKSFGIFGLINLHISNYLITVSNAKKIAIIGNTEIYQIQNVDFIQIDKISVSYNMDYIQNEINLLIAGMKKIISEGVYFSRNFDLTNSLQTQRNIKNNNKKSYDILRNANQKYLFNEPNLRPFFQSEIFSSSILINSIYGYCNSICENIKGIDINYILISRKDVGNLSLITFSIGIDEIGNISNTVETEQIIIIGLNVFSYVQIKSPPLISSNFYNVINNPEFKETDLEKFDKKKDYNFFKYHLNELNNNFRFIYIVNLLNKDKPEENAINNLLENHIKNSDNKNFKYYYFNFDGNFQHNKNKYDPLENFLLEIEDVLNIFKFFGITLDSVGSKNYFDQVGIIREICKYGLDRSNIIQMRISWLILEMQFKALKIIPYEFFGGDIVSVRQYEMSGLNNQEFLNNPNKKGIEFIIKIKKLWKENSQTLSNLYNGKYGNNENKAIFNNNNNNQQNDSQEQFDEYLRQNCI